MANIVFPLDIEPGIDMLDRMRHMTLLAYYVDTFVTKRGQK
jgi:hypothetical protein